VARAAEEGRNRRDESTADLVRDLKDEATGLARDQVDVLRSEASRIGEAVVTLARQELRLARAEMTQKSRQLVPGLGMMAAAGGLALLAAGTLTAFLVLALDGAMPAWLAALIVTAVYALAALGLYLAGRERVDEAGPLVPEQTMESVKEDVEWAKTQIGSGTR
jgi:uncharacterized membrane protein YqjE